LHAYWLVFLPAAAYQCLAIVACLKHLALSHLSGPSVPQPVSVLKPLRGLDPNTREAFISQFTQDHPQFEILFGARDAADPAAIEVQRLQQEFPQAPIRLIIGGDDAPNAKVGTLAELSRHARYPLRVINDSDIKVDPQYLSRVTAPLQDPGIGVVTCLYRVKAHNPPAAWEALGIMTDFMPSTLVAQLIGVREFGLGSTLAFRAADLEQAGGFAAIADYLADDYQLAKRITGLGKRALLSTYVVETSLGDATWRGIWLHQLRWARTIRLTKGAGHLGLPITHAGLWAAIAVSTGAVVPAIVLLGLRTLSALLSGAFVLRSPFAAYFSWLSPLWDLYSFSVWLASYAGKTVRWRDRTLKVSPDGRIIKD
jgi:ceramide glucosyltransferase